MPDTANQEHPIDTKSLGISEYQRHRDELSEGQRKLADTLYAQIQGALHDQGYTTIEEFASSLGAGSIDLKAASDMIQKMQKLHDLAEGTYTADLKTTKKVSEKIVSLDFSSVHQMRGLADGRVGFIGSLIGASESQGFIVDPATGDVQATCSQAGQGALLLGDGSIIHKQWDAHRNATLFFRWSPDSNNSQYIASPIESHKRHHYFIGMLGDALLYSQSHSIISEDTDYYTVQDGGVPQPLLTEETAKRAYPIQVTRQGLLFGTLKTNPFDKCIIDPKTGEIIAIGPHLTHLEVHPRLEYSEAEDGVFILSDHRWLKRWDSLDGDVVPLREKTRTTSFNDTVENPDEYFIKTIPYPLNPRFLITVGMSAKSIFVIDAKTGNTLATIPTERSDPRPWALRGQDSYTDFTVTPDGAIALYFPGPKSTINIYKPEGI